MSGEAKKKQPLKTHRPSPRALLRQDVDLFVFCGGDGTTRDYSKAVDMKVPVLGVPTGVKMHSALFAVSPQAAARVAISYLVGWVAASGSRSYGCG